MKRNRSTSDCLIAWGVCAFSLLLLAGLTMALTGFRWHHRNERTLRIDYADVTGIRAGSELRYAGAPVGKVVALEVLSPEQRRALANPASAVRVTVVLAANAPELPGDVQATFSSDTLLSEKFIALSAGSVGVKPLSSGAVITGLAGSSLDDLTRSGAVLLGHADAVLGTVQQTVGSLPAQLDAVLAQTRSFAANGNTLMQHADALVTTTTPRLERAIDGLQTTLGKVGELAKSADGLVDNNRGELHRSLASMTVTMQNLQVTTTYLKGLSASLAERPSRLLWGGKTVGTLPSEKAILQSRQPVAFVTTPASSAH